jgi:hypothetical protein
MDLQLRKNKASRPDGPEQNAAVQEKEKIFLQ